MSNSHPKPRSGDDEPRSKRQRVALACDSCRTRKSKCDGGRPACSVCVNMAFDCVYQRHPRSSTAVSHDKEHVSRIEDRLHAMEKLLQSVIRKNDHDGNGSGQASVSISKDLQATTTSDNMSSHSTSHKTLDGAETVYVDETDFPAAANVQEDTVDGMGVITFADEHSSAYFGPTSNSAFFNHIANAMSEGPSIDQRLAQSPWNCQVHAHLISRPSSPQRLSKNYPTVTQSAPIDDIYTLPAKPKIIHLIDLFFTEIGMLFPYIYKNWILDSLAQTRLDRLHGVRRSWLCLLNTIMAFATFLSKVSSDSIETCTTEGDLFLQRALKLLPNINFEPANLEIFQALLLMAQCLQGTQRSAQTWYLCRLTVQAAYQVGVQSSTRMAKYSPLEREIRKRSWFMCFILDKTCSMTFGRPPAIPNSFVMQEMPLNVDLEALDELANQSPALLPPQASHNSSTVIVYIESIKIYQLIGEIIDKIYQNNIESGFKISISDLCQLTISIEQELSRWKSELPSNLQVKSKDDILNDLANSPVFYQLSAVITLRYLNARILLHRGVLARFLDHDGSKEEWDFLKLFGRSSIEVSVIAASELIDIIHSVAECQHRMLTTWWFSIYYTFSAALVLFSAMVVHRKHGIQLPSCDHYDLPGSLQKALKALERLGGTTRMAVRSQKYLRKLIEIAATSDMGQGMSESFLDAGDQGMPGMVPLASSLLDLPPIDFDGGLYTMSYDWDSFPPAVN